MLTLLVPVETEEERKSIRSFVNQINNPNNYPFEKWGIQPHKLSGYRYALRFRARDAKGDWSPDLLHFGAEPRSGLGAFASIRLNPSRFTPMQLSALFDTLCATVFLDCANDPAALLSRCRVSVLHVAADFPGVSLGDFIWEKPSANVRRAYTRKGMLETLYFGESKGDQWCVYDKRAELAKQTKKTLGAAPIAVPAGALTRAEIRLRPHKLLGDLSFNENPFARLKVYDLRGAGLMFSPPLREALHLAAQAYGLARALDTLNPETRALSEKAIRASVPPWWRPDHLWAEVPGLVASLTNASGGGSLAEGSKPRGFGGLKAALKATNRMLRERKGINVLNQDLAPRCKGKIHLEMPPR